MYFDVTKVVRSPGYDHGHDEESRNGRDMKIDILDDYIRAPEVFRMFSEKTGVPEGYRNPPGRDNGPHGPWWKERGAAKVGRAPPLPLVRIGLGVGAAPPLFPSPLSPFLPPPSRSRKGGVLLLLGGGLLLLGVPTRAGRPPPCSFIYGGKGAPQRDNN